MENRIDVTLAPESQNSIMTAVNTIKTGLPFLIKLSDSDRKSLQMMDDGRKPFVEKSISLAGRNASLDPGSGLLDAAPRDLELFSFLSTLENELLQIVEMVHDTKQLAGSEAYEVGRFIYMKAKMNVKMNVPGSQAIVDELGKLFKQTAVGVKPV